MDYYINNKLIPTVAIGTWAWGDGINGSRMIFGTKTDKTLLSKVFEIAYHSNFIMWDTAPVYGMGTAECILGDFIPNGHIILSTKYMPSRNYNPRSIDCSLEKSISHFNGYVPDIYWLHTPRNIERNVQYMCSLMKAGKIKSIGVSNCNLEQIETAEKIMNYSGYHLGGVQNHYSLLYRVPERTGIIKWCNINKVPFFSYMVLEQGALTGIFNKKHGFPAFSRRAFAFPKSKLSKLEELHIKLKEIGHGYNLDIAQTAIVWGISKGTIPIIGITKPIQADALKNLSNVTLSEKNIYELEKIALQTGIEVAGSWERQSNKGC